MECSVCDSDLRIRSRGVQKRVERWRLGLSVLLWKSYRPLLCLTSRPSGLCSKLWRSCSTSGKVLLLHLLLLFVFPLPFSLAYSHFFLLPFFFFLFLLLFLFYHLILFINFLFSFLFYSILSFFFSNCSIL